ncbi:class I SAM-dependent methyltransferase [Verrucomicrobia bacterium]|nr:class I SAM-dependent methyltransferase [Verrucomicrobiota bacterium]
MKPITYWLTAEELQGIYTADYWNNLDEEKRKATWIEDGDYGKCFSHLKSKGLWSEYHLAQNYIENHKGNDFVVADLAAGIGWGSALMSKLSKVKEIHAVEISKHRIERLFPECVKMLEGDSAKISRYVGSFYNLDFESHRFDIVYLSCAFHHAQNPFALLTEVDRVLKPGGRVILVGEQYMGAWRRIRRFVSHFMKNKSLTFNFRKLFPADDLLGDHYYRICDYYFMFETLKYTTIHSFDGRSNVVYIADKP